MTYPKCEIPKAKCNARDENGVCKIHAVCQPIIDKCEGCDRIENGYCTAYINPEAKWRVGGPDGICPLASHVKREVEKVGKVRLGQQKQKKGR